uniref:Uncharacterized protein n=1 Tax=viral metagenome TaxID=1070528 RepID=A0A6M3M2J0_9ZZZZ
MTLFELEAGSHRIKWTLSGYNDLVATISITSAGIVTCTSVENGICGGSVPPNVTVSGNTVMGFMTYSGVSPPPASNQYIYIEAENAKSIELPIAIVQDIKASGGRFVRVPDGISTCDLPIICSKAGYEVFITKSGTYKIVGLILANSINHNSLRVSVNDETSFVWHMPVSDSWIWANVTDTGKDANLSPTGTPKTFDLKLGKNTFNIYRREPNVNFDKFLITNVINFMPPGAGMDTFENWVEYNGGKDGLLSNLSALLEICDAYLGFVQLGFTATLSNLLKTCDYYLGFD